VAKNETICSFWSKFALFAFEFALFVFQFALFEKIFDKSQNLEFFGIFQKRQMKAINSKI